MGKLLAQGVHGSVATYESVLLAHGFHRCGRRYIVPDGDFGFNIARDRTEPDVQCVTAFLSIPGREVVDANPKWDVEPDGIADLIPELCQWAIWARSEYRTNGH